MPLVALAVAAYASGLLAAFAGLTRVALAAAVAMFALGGWRRDARSAALAMLGAGGVITAATAVARDGRCQLTALRAAAWQVRFATTAAPGDFVVAPARAVTGCTVRAGISVARGRAVAGGSYLVYGTARPTRAGIRIAHARIGASAAARSPLLALREATGRRIDSLFGGDAPLVRALVIADAREVDPAMRDRFAAAGIAHLLAISGLHVAIIAGAAELLLIALHLPRAWAVGAAVGVTALYVAMIGAPAPALRAGLMIGVLAATRLAQRPTSPWAALALGAAAPLADPRAVLAVGYQLSVVGVASLTAAGVLARRHITPRLRGWKAQLARGLLASTVAALATAPLVAWHFGRVSLIAPLTNLIAGPLMAAIQPALFIALLAQPVAPAARLFAGAVHPLLAALDGLARLAGSVPGGSVFVAPTLLEAVLAGVAAAGLLVACASAWPARPLIVALAAAAVAIGIPLAPERGTGELEMHLLNVGQGDAVALRTPRGRWVLIDAGGAWPSGDAGRSSVIPYLRRRGGSVALFILTHPHADHVGGAASVLRSLRPGAYWDGAFAGTSGPYLASLLAGESAAVPWHRAHPGDSVAIDGVLFRVLAPDSAWMVHLRNPNAASVVVRVRYGRVHFLLMGDAEAAEEHWLLSHAPDRLGADVLKVGHHGSRTSSTADFLAAVRPRLALISVGAGNGYGLPNSSVLRALAGRGAAVLRTDREGTIVVRTDGRRLRIEEGGDEWTLSPAQRRR